MHAQDAQRAIDGGARHTYSGAKLQLRFQTAAAACAARIHAEDVILLAMASREGSRQSVGGGQDSATELAAAQRHHRKGHRRSIMLANVAETLKVKQVGQKSVIFHLR